MRVYMPHSWLAVHACASTRTHTGRSCVQTDLFGKPIYCEAGLWGHRNDRGLWSLTDIYNHQPDKYLTGQETLLMDGVFQGDLHCKTTRGAIIPADKKTLNAATAADRAMLHRG